LFPVAGNYKAAFEGRPLTLSCPSSFGLRGSRPRDVFVAPGPQRETPEGHAAAGRVLGPPEEGPGENFPEAEIHQQTRQEEARQ